MVFLDLMKIGIISDSHDHIENIRKSVGVFKENKVAFVIHVGDFINPKMIKEFEGMKLIGIFGNNDGEKLGLINAFNSINGDLKGDFCELKEGGVKFAIYHGTIPQLRNALIEWGKYDVVIYGHDHILKNKKIGKTIVINPGTAHGFGEKATIALFDIKTKKVEFVEL